MGCCDTIGNFGTLLALVATAGGVRRYCCVKKRATLSSTCRRRRVAREANGTSLILIFIISTFSILRLSLNPSLPTNVSFSNTPQTQAVKVPLDCFDGISPTTSRRQIFVIRTKLLKPTTSF